MGQLILLGSLEGAHALEHLVPINLETVELRPVDAHELGLATDGQTTGPTHSRAIYHDGIQGYISGDIVFLGQQTTELHHDGRTDGKHLVDMFLLDKFLHTHGHYTFLSVRTVVGHDEDLVGRRPYFIFQDDEVFAPACQNGQHTVAGGFQRADDRQHGGDTHTTTGANHCAELLDMCGIAQGTHNVGDVIAFVQIA